MRYARSATFPPVCNSELSPNLFHSPSLSPRKPRNLRKMFANSVVNGQALANRDHQDHRPGCAACDVLEEEQGPSLSSPSPAKPCTFGNPRPKRSSPTISMVIDGSEPAGGLGRDSTTWWSWSVRLFEILLVPFVQEDSINAIAVVWLRRRTHLQRIIYGSGLHLHALRSWGCGYDAACNGSSEWRPSPRTLILWILNMMQTTFLVSLK